MLGAGNTPEAEARLRALTPERLQESDETYLVSAKGCDAVKVERGGTYAERARAILGAGIPVMGHIGLTPQTATALGG